MAKNVALVVLGIAVIALAAIFLLPRLGVGGNKKPFDPETIANEIVLEVGSSSISNSILCSAVDGMLGTSTGSFCRQSRYSPGEARSRIDDIVRNYRAEPNADWDVSEAGYTRSFTNPDKTSVEAITQNVLVMVTPDIIIVSYDE